MRYEIKFRIEGHHWKEVEHVVLTHPSAFREIHESRCVHNVYFDNSSMGAFHENVAGVNIRSKVRVRWYETLGELSKPQLEIKHKHNMLGAKKVIPLDEIQPMDFVSLSQRVNEVVGVPMRIVFHSHYVRSYYRSFDNRFRITLDREMYFRPVNQLSSTSFLPREDKAVILELKFSQEVTDNELDSVTQFLPFKVTKNSKYARGVLLTEGH